MHDPVNMLISSHSAKARCDSASVLCACAAAAAEAQAITKQCAPVNSAPNNAPNNAPNSGKYREVRVRDGLVRHPDRISDCSSNGVWNVRMKLP